jgi:hypothetical protein
VPKKNAWNHKRSLVLLTNRKDYEHFNQARGERILSFRLGIFRIVAAGGRDEETSRITQCRQGRSKIGIVSEPQAATAHQFSICDFRMTICGG